MVTITLDKSQARDLVTSLSHYRREWEGYRKDIDRKIRLMSGGITCATKKDIEEMQVDAKIADSAIEELSHLEKHISSLLRQAP